MSKSLTKRGKNIKNKYREINFKVGQEFRGIFSMDEILLKDW